MKKEVHEILRLGQSGAELTLAPGDTFVVTGPNGVGKSAFLAHVPSDFSVERFFGSRAISFTSDETSEVGQTVQTLMANIAGSTNRYLNHWGEQHLKSVVKRLMQKESQAAQDIVKKLNGGATYLEVREKVLLPLNQLNSVFEAGRLPVHLYVDESGELCAKRGNASFGINRMSDGERAALLVVAAILVRPKNSFILIDEPERHLNPSISGPLIAAAVRARPDVGFLFATHDLSLIEWLKPEKIIHIQDSEMMFGSVNDQRRYTYAILGQGEDLPETLRYALLGSRKALLIVEGTASSEDRALYSHVYPNWNVIPREGSGSVQAGVAALRENGDYHWLRVAGLIDGDGRSLDERQVLERKQVFSLPVPTIENIFFMKEILFEMASAVQELFGLPTAQERLDLVEKELRNLLLEEKDEMIARRVAWAANRALESKKVSVDEIRANKKTIDPIDLLELKSTIKSEYDLATLKGDVYEALGIMPIKNTKIPGRLAKSMGYGSAKSYYQAILTQIQNKTERGARIITLIQASLPPLPAISF
ncbi:AAA family ATPase [Rhizobium sp. CFBP 13726]|uniref:AAA family ATPase n=1 Tax=Rhizobium sp. CFBP 13726 TaxID=2775296 RepID=UPI001785D6AA|nr:AAA family ATPase [Rhizobium sp. CFBP 13726]MBD8650850.1 AAA family ATPase [Rhizobium sp. CFBP 13726]